MKILYYEMRKSWFKIPVLAVFIILAVINVLRVRKETAASTSETAGDFFAVYDDFCGEINDEMINRLQSELDKLPEFSVFTVFDPEYNPEKYKYTGYQARDLFALLDAKDDITYAVTYPNISNNITKKAYENVRVYEELGAKYRAKRSSLIYSLYQNRSISEYRYVDWAEKYFKYDFSSLLCIIMLILGLSGTFSGECENGMNTLISAYGKRGKTIAAKIISAVLYCLILSAFFSALDFLTVMSANRVEGLALPLYSAEIFAKTPLNVTIIGAVFWFLLMRFCALFAISALIMFISKVSPNTIIAECFSFAACVGLIVLSGFRPSVLNPVNMLAPAAYITEFEAVNLFGTPVLSAVAAILSALAASAFLCCLTAFLGRKSNV